MCLDSLEYVGLIKLYTDYSALKDKHSDLTYRFDLLDKNYLLCNKSLKQANNSLVVLNKSRDELIQKNLILYDKSINYERKIKNWRVFGACVSISLVSVVTILILTN